ncbi:N-acetyltransferase family protein [Massilia sp. IC2-477]|uniref:arsinothricin resistance N-acetyltransferase ArsN1 family B n=1 Tax=Massilia sp. IC2-477 TaxID=2887198 RepID=UPI001D112B8E|nr:arsinothricin resistance N-acetyltransferase ArsN1 family B [Massilia sp. IC2-477]MCC2957790.1 N-acetyltransferase family protein [Massilia sp. IC2-477]
MSAITIRPATVEDAAAICAVYNPYIATTTISFEEEPVSAADMAQRIVDVAASSLPWLVACREGRLLGYAYATKWRARPAYRTSVESSVYLDRQEASRGLGTALYQALLDELRAREVHMVIGGIAQPNERSVALHEKLGFRKVAHFSEVGRKFGRWVDVGYWELRLQD